MHPCEPFRSGAPHAYFGAPQGAPCAKVEERCSRPAVLNHTAPRTGTTPRRFFCQSAKQPRFPSSNWNWSAFMFKSVRSWSMTCGLRLNRLGSSVSFILGFCTPFGVSRVVFGAPISACLHRGPHVCFRSECCTDVESMAAQRMNCFLAPDHQRRARSWTSHKSSV